MIKKTTLNVPGTALSDFIFFLVTLPSAKGISSLPKLSAPTHNVVTPSPETCYLFFLFSQLNSTLFFIPMLPFLCYFLLPEISPGRPSKKQPPSLTPKRSSTNTIFSLYRHLKHPVKGRSQANAVAQQALIAHWQSILKSLNFYLKIMKANHIFSFINVQLFNSLLLRRECCSFSNGEFVKTGLAELENLCHEATKEYAGSAWDELRHIRQAVGFLLYIKSLKKL
ncbi:unnamed protein product, partial [Vitis vinifera]